MDPRLPPSPPPGLRVVKCRVLPISNLLGALHSHDVCGLRVAWCLEHAPRITHQGPSDSGLLEAGCKASACIPQPHTQPSSSHPLPVVALVVGRHHQVPFNLSSARSPPVCPSSLRVARTLCRTPLTPGASLWLPVITYHDLDLIATTTVPRFGLADLLARAPRYVLGYDLRLVEAQLARNDGDLDKPALMGSLACCAEPSPGDGPLRSALGWLQLLVIAMGSRRIRILRRGWLGSATSFAGPAFRDSEFNAPENLQMGRSKPLNGMDVAEPACCC
jgi:hypothetical protein